MKSEEDLMLEHERIQRFLNGPSPPGVLSAEPLKFDERRYRALAEIDGLYAGLSMYDEIFGEGQTGYQSQSHAPPNLGLDDASLVSLRVNDRPVERFPDPDPDWSFAPEDHIDSQFPNDDSSHIIPISHQNGDLTLDRLQNNVEKAPEEPALTSTSTKSSVVTHADKKAQNPLPTAIFNTREHIKEASRSPKHLTESSEIWLVLKDVKDGLKQDLDCFRKLCKASSSPSTRALHDLYKDANELAYKGIQTYREVLSGIMPETFSEVFSFASLSYVLSILLLERGRFEKKNVLSGIRRWRNQIRDEAERRAFDTLAPLIWRLDHLPEELAQWDSDHAYEDFDSKSDAPDFPEDVEQELRDIARFGFDGLKTLSTPMNNDEFTPMEMSYNVLDVAEPMNDAFHFTERFSPEDPATLGNNSIPIHSVPDFSPPEGIDPRDIRMFCDGQIPNYTQPWDDICTQTPWKIGLEESFTPLHQFQFQTPEPDGPSKLEISSINSRFSTYSLMDTDSFLAVLAFVEEEGEFFFVLSGRGKTVVSQKRGSAPAEDRPEMQETFYKDYFELLKSRMAGRPIFLALLSVADHFVVLGSLGSWKEVQDYLLVASVEILEPGEEYAEFVRSIYSFVGKKEKETADVDAWDEALLRNAKFWGSSGVDASVGGSSPTSRKAGPYSCHHAGCNKVIKDYANFKRHLKAHDPTAPEFQCEVPGCLFRTKRKDTLARHMKPPHRKQPKTRANSCY